VQRNSAPLILKLAATAGSLQYFLYQPDPEKTGAYAALQLPGRFSPEL
jgi:hypothetical protein